MSTSCYYRKLIMIVVMSVALLLGNAMAGLAESPTFTLVIENHQFIPSELQVPANEKIKLIVENRDSIAEEFESYDLHREKMVAPKGKITLFLGPLKPGRYKFFGEFHPKTAQGVLVVTSTNK